MADERELLLNRLNALKPWRRGDERAPHKPLLILLALGRVARKEPRLALFTELEGPLTGLLKNFGPPRVSYHPEYPFWRLQQQKIWEVTYKSLPRSRASNSDPPRSELRSQGAKGGFTETVYERLVNDPALVAEVTKVLLDSSFPPSLHEDILDEVGLALGAAPVGPRDPHFRAEVIMAYERRCAICGFDLKVGATDFGVEAAHIKWRQAGGPDEVSNGLALCTVHHKALDRGAIGIDEDMTILISADLHGRSWAREWFELFKGQPLRKPSRAEWYPNQAYVRWHYEEVFRVPAKD